MTILLPSLAYGTALIALLFKSRQLTNDEASEQARTAKSLPIQILLLLLLLVHGIALQSSIFTSSGFIFGFAQALSLMAWVGVAFYWIENWVVPLRGMLILVLGMATVFSFFPAIFPGSVLSDRATHSVWFKLHFFVANAAYGLMSLAALHAILMSWQDKKLRHHRPSSQMGFVQSILFGSGSGWMDKLPPLMTMERVLFSLLRVGFALLTLTVFSGVFFTQLLFGKPLIFDHKTIFALASWVMFGGLLLARWRSGMRGLQALRWVLGAFIVLMLAYVGSRFVLEVLLHRA